MDALTEFAISGPFLFAALLALAAGAVSFASPCCVPLVPGYLAYLTGLAGEPGSSAYGTAPEGNLRSAAGVGDPHTLTGERPARETGAHRRERLRLLWAASLFVAGFTIVFSAGAVGVLGLSDLLIRNEALLQRVGGVATIAMGLVFLGLVPALQREVRIHRRPRRGLWGASVLGGVFGLGWTPCLGPTLTGVIALAAGTQVGPATVRGLLLVVAYSIGLGVPFLLLALGVGWAVRATDWIRRHTRRIQITGGVLLVVVGVLLVTGLWGAFIAWMRAPIGGFTTPL